jgi:hypothetical protein
MKVNYKTIIKFLVLGLLVVNLALLFWYVFFGYQHYFHSDSAAKVLLAREIFDTGNFFPGDWNYANSDLFIIFGHIFIIPLLFFMPAGFLAHAISGILFSLLILHSIWLVAGLGEISKGRRIAVVAVFAAGISGFISENLYGQVSYGVVILFSCYVIYVTSRYLSAINKDGTLWIFLLITIMLLVYWSNPKRALISYSIPLVFACQWIYLCSEIENRKRCLYVIGFSFIGAALGAALHAITIKELSIVSGAANASWLSFENISRNAPLIFKGLYAQLGGLTIADAPLFSKLGLYSGIRFLIATLILVLMPVALFRGLLSQSYKMSLVSSFAITSLALLIFLQATTTIPDMRDPIQSSRYLVPAIILGLIVLLVSPLNWSIKPPLFSISVWIITIILLSSGYLSYRFNSLNSEILAQPLQLVPNRSDLISVLRANNLKYGYASYWNAGSISVMSDETIKVRPVHMHGVPTPFRHLSSNSWYRPEAWEGKTFLLAHNSELTKLDFDKLGHLELVPIEKIQKNDFTIFVFRENLAKKIPGWETRLQKPLTFLPNPASLRQTGKFNNKDGQNTLIAEKGEAGALHYGPYIDLEPGKYRVIFDVIAQKNLDGVIRLDVAAAPNQKLYGEVSLIESSTPQAIEFTLDKKQTIEFRVWTLGNEKVIFKGFKLYRLNLKNNQKNQILNTKEE